MVVFGTFGFTIGLFTMTLASLAFSQVAGVRAEVARLRAE